MGSTYFSLHPHLVFSTKERRPFIQSKYRAELHRYLGGTARCLGAVALEVGGIQDQVHLLLGLRTTRVVADLVQELKKASGGWAKSRHRPLFA
jgi:putative transposase